MKCKFCIALKDSFFVWTVNLKSFEIGTSYKEMPSGLKMNCKLEKFWNTKKRVDVNDIYKMNCKLEKFWNSNTLKYYPQGEINEL